MSNALQGLMTGNREGKPEKRNQVIYTPEPIWQVCYQTWPEGIVLDPCSGPGSIGVSDHRNLGPEFGGLDALRSKWPERCYINPPYAALKAWLAHSGIGGEQIWLVPNRTRSKWYRDWRDTCTVYAELNRICFLGYPGSYPESLVLGYRGERGDMFEGAVRKVLGLACYRGVAVP